MTKLSAPQRLHLKKLIKDLKSQKALHTEFITVYIPAGYDISKIIGHLADEQGTASNIKSSATRKNVQAGLEKMIQHLKNFKKTPENGLAVFSGNTASAEGRQDIKVWSFEPPTPLNIRIYRCDKHFITDVLDELLVEKEVYGLVVLDRRDANIALLKGKTIINLQKTHSEVPGKFKAGGQCQVYGTLVQSATGNILKIENCSGALTVQGMNVNERIIDNSPVKDFWKVKKSKIYKIKTKYPQLITETSQDHIFFTIKNNQIIEKTASELTAQDTLLMPEKIKIKGTRQKLNYLKYYNSFIINKEGQKLLKKRRIENKLLQKELAKKLNATQTTISSYEIGKINANRIPLKKICQELKINFSEFLKDYTLPSHHQGTEIYLPNEITPEFAQFLGYYMGDGCSEKDRITFFEQREDVVFAYQKMLNDFFNIQSSCRFRENKNYHQLRFTSRPLVRMIKGEFPELKKALDSEIPKKILEAESIMVAKFLKGIFDTEGYLMEKGVGIGLNNKTVIGQLQLLLLRFSIISSVMKDDNKKNPYSNNPVFKLQINEKESLENFQELIDFTAKDKSDKLKKVISKKTSKSQVRQIMVSGSKIREMIEMEGGKVSDFSKVSSFFNNKRLMSKNTFKSSILDNIKNKKLYNKLNKIYKHSLLPVKIAEIEQREENVDMVDISVNNQNFIANGIMVHNSAQRFARQREGAYKDHFKKIAGYMKDQFLPLGNNLKGIIIGGPGTTVNSFLGKDYITGDIKKKIIGTKDLSYTGDFGLQELLDKSGDLLAEEEVAQEKKIMEKFFKQMLNDMKKVAYGKKEVNKALNMAAVDVLLVSETMPENDIIGYEEKAQESGAELKIISTETREGVQLKDLGKIAAILRYPIEQ